MHLNLPIMAPMINLVPIVLASNIGFNAFIHFCLTYVLALDEIGEHVLPSISS